MAMIKGIRTEGRREYWVKSYVYFFLSKERKGVKKRGL